MWILATLYFRAEVRGLDRVPEEGPVLFDANHSGGNMTPDSLVFMRRVQHLLRRDPSDLRAGARTGHVVPPDRPAREEVGDHHGRARGGDCDALHRTQRPGVLG